MRGSARGARSQCEVVRETCSLAASRRTRREPRPRHLHCNSRCVTTMKHLRSAIALVALAAPVAQAEPVSSNEPQRQPTEPQPPPLPPPESPETSAADVARAPVPGDEHGRTDPVDSGDSAARVVARGLLWLPKLVVDTALTPVRGTVWAFERYKLADRYYDT